MCGRAGWGEGLCWLPSLMTEWTGGSPPPSLNVEDRMVMLYIRSCNIIKKTSISKNITSIQYLEWGYWMVVCRPHPACSNFFKGLECYLWLSIFFPPKNLYVLLGYDMISVDFPKTNFPNWLSKLTLSPYHLSVEARAPVHLCIASVQLFIIPSHLSLLSAPLFVCVCVCAQTSSSVADGGSAACGRHDGHGFSVAELQGVSLLHRIVASQKCEFHHLRQAGQQWLWKQIRRQWAPTDI